MAQSDNEFSVRVENVAQFSQEATRALTLVWVLKGTQTLTVEGTQSRLGENDLHIVNSGQRWALAGEPDNVTLRLSLSADWIGQIYDDFFGYDYLIPDESEGRWPRCDELRHLLRQLLAGTLLNHAGRYRLEANRWIAEILLLLASRFQQPRRRSQPPSAAGWSRRIGQVVERINASYTRRITLAEIARAEFVSEPWLSRLFHKEVGMSFMQYITRLRLEKAADALRQSRQPLHQIALANGFASTRMMSDLFRRRYGMTPREFRQQTSPSDTVNRPRAESDGLYPVAPNRLFSLLNAAQPADWEPSAETRDRLYEYPIDVEKLPQRGAPLRQSGIIVTLRELDDLLRSDVRRDLDALRKELSISGIDIAEPFLSSRLFSHGWDDPLMTGYASWYNLHQIFTWLDERGLSVLLHTSQTTSSELLQRFLQQATAHFPPSVTRRWDLVFHWSPQAGDAAWHRQRAIITALLPQAKIGIWHRFAPRTLPAADSELIAALPQLRADFIACTADSNARLDLAAPDPAGLSATENYPVERIRQIQTALRQQGLSLPVWLLAWNTLTGDTRATNGSFFRGALLMQTLLGLSGLAAVCGVWLNSGLQGETRSGESIDTSSLALHHNHGLPRPIYWVLWFWQRLRGEIVAQDKHLLLLRHAQGYQLLLYNAATFNPWLSGEAAFLQRLRQQYLIRLGGLQGNWRIKGHLYDLRNGALFPLLAAFQASSGPDEEVLNWIRHRARPTLSVHDEGLQGAWQASGALESNALMLYELTPVPPPGSAQNRRA